MALVITGGSLKGRRLVQHRQNKNVRPSMSLLRQAVFNIWQNRIRKSRFLDLFAGSGIMGMEALSRGAEAAFFVEKNRKTAQEITENLKHLKLLEKSKVFNCSFEKALPLLPKEKIDLAYADPPYACFQEKNFGAEFLKKVQNASCWQKNACLFIEMPAEKMFSGQKILTDENHSSYGWKYWQGRKYGSSFLAGFCRQS